MRLNLVLRSLLGAVALLSLILLSIGESKAQSKEQLEKIVKEHGGGIWVLQAGTQKYSLASQHFTGVLEIDLGSSSLAATLGDREEFARPQARAELLQFARQMVSEAVQQRQKGNWPGALFLYRFALHVVSRIHEWDGIKAIASNLWFLREAIKHYVNGEALPLFGDLYNQANSAENKARRENFKQLLELIRADAQPLSHAVEELLGKLSPSATPEKMLMLECARLVADLADNVSLRRSNLLELRSVTESLNERQAFQVAITQELAQTTLTDFLIHQRWIKD